VIAGYWLIGRPLIETRPAMTTIIERTVDRIGRFMKMEEIN
jgi:hypothetical protein